MQLWNVITMFLKVDDMELKCSFKMKKFLVFPLVLQFGKVMSTVALYQLIGFAVSQSGHDSVLVHDTTGRMLVLDNQMRHFNNKISTMASWAVPPWCICWWILHLSVGCGFVTTDIVPCTNFQRNYSWFPSFHKKQEINSGTCLQYGIPIRRLIYQTSKKICTSLLHSWIHGLYEIPKYQIHFHLPTVSNGVMSTSLFGMPPESGQRKNSYIYDCYTNAT